MALIELGEHVRKAIECERELVAQRLEQVREQAERLHALVEQVDSDVEQTARMLRNMDEMLGLAPQLSIEYLDGEIRGQRLREIAVEVLRQNKRLGQEVHYRDWYQLVVGTGIRVAGKDPLATFLTQIARAPEVESVRPRSGLYRLVSA